MVDERTDGNIPISETLASTLDLLEWASDPDRVTERLVPTGLADVDDALGGGLWPGHLTVIGGRPGAGSSTLGLGFLRHAAVTLNLPALLLCGDTSNEEINIRLLSAMGRVPIHHMRTGMMSEHDWTRLADVTGQLAQAPLSINTDPMLTIQKVTDAIEDAVDNGIRLVVIDGLQSLDQEVPRDSRYTAVCDDVHALKRLARRHNIPVVVISKLNRTTEQRVSKRPMLTDLRNAGDIEDVADEVLMLHREDMYESESTRPGEADIEIIKHRHGPTRWTIVAFQGHIARFVDIVR